MNVTEPTLEAVADALERMTWKPAQQLPCSEMLKRQGHHHDVGYQNGRGLSGHVCESEVEERKQSECKTSAGSSIVDTGGPHTSCRGKSESQAGGQTSTAAQAKLNEVSASTCIKN